MSRTEILEGDKGYFSHKGFAGIALYVSGYPKVYEPYWDFDDEGFPVYLDEGEWEENPYGPTVLVRMVGDDKDHTVDRADLTAIKRGEFCGGCGQIGCGCDPYDDE